MFRTPELKSVGERAMALWYRVPLRWRYCEIEDGFEGSCGCTFLDRRWSGRLVLLYDRKKGRDQLRRLASTLVDPVLFD